MAFLRYRKPGERIRGSASGEACFGRVGTAPQLACWPSAAALHRLWPDSWRRRGLCAPRPFGLAFANGKGSWCKDCITALGTALNATHARSVFGQHLNGQELCLHFDLTLATYATLKMDEAKITSGLLHQMVEAIKLAARLTCWPLGHTLIYSLAAVESGS